MSNCSTLQYFCYLTILMCLCTNLRGGRREGSGVLCQYSRCWRSGRTGYKDYVSILPSSPLQAGGRHGQWSPHSKVHALWRRTVQSGHRLWWKPSPWKSIYGRGYHAPWSLKGEELSTHVPLRSWKTFDFKQLLILNIVCLDGTYYPELVQDFRHLNNPNQHFLSYENLVLFQ